MQQNKLPYYAGSPPKYTYYVKCTYNMRYCVTESCRSVSKLRYYCMDRALRGPVAFHMFRMRVKKCVKSIDVFPT